MMMSISTLREFGEAIFTHITQEVNQQIDSPHERPTGDNRGHLFLFSKVPCSVRNAVIAWNGLQTSLTRFGHQALNAIDFIDILSFSYLKETLTARRQ